MSFPTLCWRIGSQLMNVVLSFDERGVVVPEHRVNRRAVDDRRRRGDVVLAAGLPVVVLPPLLEVVEAGDEIVRAQSLRGQEVARFSEPVPVVAMLEPSPAAYRAEGGRVEHRIGGTDEPLAIRYGRALHEIGEAGAGVHRRRDFPRVLTFE